MCSDDLLAKDGKICLTSQGDNLDSTIDARFGRCLYFIIVDLETGGFEAIENPNTDSTGGAGVQSGQLVAERKVKAVLTGNVGPNAYNTLSAANIQVITGVSGKVNEAIEKYKKGEFKSIDGPSVDSKFGAK